MKTIFFPTDFSENANHASLYAAAIAEKSGARLILFNAFWVPVDKSDSSSLIRTKEDESQINSLKGLLKSEKSIKAVYPNISATLMTSNGFTADEIAAAARENKADLIVMGTKGASGLKEVIMGSNTVDVIGKGVCPVLAIPEKAKGVKFEKFVFASNFSEQDTEDIKFLTALGKLFDAQITITHVSEDDFIIETADQAILQKIKREVKVKTRYEKLQHNLLKGNVIDELNKYVIDNEADLLAMVTSKRHFLSKIFNKSFTQKMAFHSKVPLLVLHNSEVG